MINLELNLGINNNATTSSSNSQLSSLSAQSFSTMLSEALSETLSQFGIDPSSVTLTVSPGESQANATSQNSDAASQNSAATSSQNSAATIVSPFSQAAAIAAFPETTATTPSSSSPSWSSTSTSATTSSSSGSGSGSGNGSGVQSASLPVSESYDDAYWAQQPPAVQKLRDMTNYEAREQLGAQLAQQGYTIDVPIMVWGWDPSKVMATREAAGYTWVPSGLQQPVEMAPGISVPGEPSYDPNNPPAGSIRV